MHIDGVWIEGVDDVLMVYVEGVCGWCVNICVCGWCMCGWCVWLMCVDVY